MLYEFDIMETRYAQDDAEADEEGRNPLELLKNQLNAQARQGWDLIDTHVEVFRSITLHERPRTERFIFSIWRRPLEEV